MSLPTALKAYLCIGFLMIFVFYAKVTNPGDSVEKRASAVTSSLIAAFVWPLWALFLPFELIDAYKRS